jgi:hypothetical protein
MHFRASFLSLPYVLLANTLLLLVCVQSMAKRDHAKRMQSMREWTDDELRLLDKAVKKFPMGTPKRWEQVGDCVWHRARLCRNNCGADVCNITSTNSADSVPSAMAGV